jgi:hypothetical protein
MREGIYADVLCPDFTNIQATPEVLISGWQVPL